STVSGNFNRGILGGLPASVLDLGAHGISLQNTTGTALIENSSIIRNGSSSAGVGGIAVRRTTGQFTIRNSTISENSRDDFGGIAVANTIGPVFIQNSTVSNNASAQTGGVFITSSGTVTIQSTIIANTTGAIPPTANDIQRLGSGELNVSNSLIK